MIAANSIVKTLSMAVLLRRVRRTFTMWNFQLNEQFLQILGDFFRIIMESIFADAPIHYFIDAYWQCKGFEGRET